MTSRNALLWGTERLRSVGIESASLDAEILLAHTLKITKEKLFAHPEHRLTRLQLTTYRRLIKRRAKHEPIAYILGRKEFYGLDFLVDRRVLIPRPETELMVEEVVKLITPPDLPLSGEGLFKILHLMSGRQRGLKGMNIIDIGTGSGCIIISLAKLLTTHYSLQTKFFATDASPAAITLARRNARLHSVDKKITFLHGNLLDPFLRDYSLHATRPQRSRLRGGRAPYTLFITANLPYLPTAEWRRTPPDIKNHEPRVALDGGTDGLEYYRQLFAHLKQLYTLHFMPPSDGTPPKAVALYTFLEICPHQADSITKLTRKFFPKARVQIKKDLAGHKRLALVSF